LINSVIMWYIEYDMLVICVRHGTPFDKEGECVLCNYEVAENIREDVHEAQRRIKWEKRHRKELGK